MGSSEPLKARSEPEGAVRISVIGAFRVHVGDRPATAPRAVSRKARTLLKLLSVEDGHVVPTDRVVEVLWSRPPAKPVENVATLVSRLRGWLGTAVIEGGREGYRLAPSVEVDLGTAESLTARAEQELRAAQPGVALVPAERALDLLSAGRVLEDEPYASWAEPARGAQVALLRRARLAHVDAALAADEPALATTVAAAGMAEDPLDEQMARRLMTAQHASGAPARALAAYARLRAELAESLGVGPSPETEALHAVMLRDEPVPAGGQPGITERRSGRAALVERERDLDTLRDAWGDAATGRSSLRLVVGEAGIGKTSLAEALAGEVSSSGGVVLRARCYEAERSLFLQPLVDALTPALTAMAPHRLRELAGQHVAALTALVPAAAAALGPPVELAPRAEEARRRAFEAVLHLLRRLGEDAPVLLLLDDLHNAGTTTSEAVRYLGRHSPGARLLVVATVRRDEGRTTLATLGDVGALVEPRPLSADAVAQLAGAAGLTDQGDAIARRTGGHPFFVVEVIRGLVAGQETVPESLQAAVLGRVARAGEGVDRLLRAAAVLSTEVDPASAAALLEVPEQEAAERCERALDARLLAVSGRAYEFVNDLVREVLYDSTPAPTRIGWHRRAADLAGDNHEAMAHHADAAGETSRSATAWLLAAEAALARFAASDAEAFASRAADAAAQVGSTEVLGRAWLLRARALEVREAYDDALTDLLGAADLAGRIGDQRLEMTAQRELAGDVPVALGLGTGYCVPHVDRGLVLARSLGARGTEADLLARRAVILSNRLQLDESVAAGEAAVAAARASEDPVALVAALDGLKTALAFVGDVQRLRPVIDELEPQLRRHGDLWRLQWCVFESSYPAIAGADWGLAESRIRAALEINRRSGYLAYGTWFEAHLGWLLRLAERDEEALEVGRRAVAAPVGGQHPWWRSSARLLLAGTLVEVGARSEAIDLLEEAVTAAEQDGSMAYLLGCRALLADVTGDPAALAAADSLLREVRAPAGQVWLLGADAYLAVARAWTSAGDLGRSREVLEPLVVASRSQGWRPVLARALLQQAVNARRGGDRTGSSLAGEAASLAGAVGLRRLQARAEEVARG